MLGIRFLTPRILDSQHSSVVPGQNKVRTELPKKNVLEPAPAGLKSSAFRCLVQIQQMGVSVPSRVRPPVRLAAVMAGMYLDMVRMKNILQKNYGNLPVALDQTVKSIQESNRVILGFHGARSGKSFHYSTEKDCYFVPALDGFKNAVSQANCALGYTFGVGQIQVLCCKKENVSLVKSFVAKNAFQAHYVSGPEHIRNKVECVAVPSEVASKGPTYYLLNLYMRYSTSRQSAEASVVDSI